MNGEEELDDLLACLRARVQCDMLWPRRCQRHAVIRLRTACERKHEQRVFTCQECMEALLKAGASCTQCKRDGYTGVSNYAGES